MNGNCCGNCPIGEEKEECPMTLEDFEKIGTYPTVVKLITNGKSSYFSINDENGFKDELRKPESSFGRGLSLGSFSSVKKVFGLVKTYGKEITEEEFKKGIKIRSSMRYTGNDGYDIYAVETGEEDAVFTDEDEEIIKNRLRSLGHFD